MEPAVKPAALGTRTGVIGVLATAGTLKASKYLKTKGLYQDNVRIEEHVGEGFVQLVERLELDGPETERVVRASLQPLLDAGADTIVLGCTHYPFLRPVIERIAGPDIRVIDPAPAVAKQVLKVLSERGLLSPDTPSSFAGAPSSFAGLTGDPSKARDGDRQGGKSPALELLSSGDPATLRRLAAMIG